MIVVMIFHKYNGGEYLQNCELNLKICIFFAPVLFSAEFASYLCIFLVCENLDL